MLLSALAFALTIITVMPAARRFRRRIASVIAGAIVQHEVSGTHDPNFIRRYNRNFQDRILIPVLAALLTLLILTSDAVAGSITKLPGGVQCADIFNDNQLACFLNIEIGPITSDTPADVRYLIAHRDSYPRKILGSAITLNSLGGDLAAAMDQYRLVWRREEGGGNLYYSADLFSTRIRQARFGGDREHRADVDLTKHIAVGPVRAGRAEHEVRVPDHRQVAPWDV